MISETKSVSVRSYLRRKQVAPKTWLVTTVRAYQRGKPKSQSRRPEQPNAVAA